MAVSGGVHNRDRKRKRLNHLLSLADDQSFLRMIWAVDALQSDRESAAKKHIIYPPNVATTDISSPHAVFKWELETLVGQLLIIRKKSRNKRGSVTLNCVKFDTAAEITNTIRSLEDFEATVYLRAGKDIFKEMHRIGHRQFPWQRGNLNIVHFYRNIYILGSGECGAYFEKTHGVSINDFNAVGFALFAAFQAQPMITRSINLEFLGLKHDALSASLKLLSAPFEVVADRAKQLERGTRASDGSSFPTAYLPSAIRQYPLLEFGEDKARIYCPLPSLIINRITSGIYYDLANAPSGLRNVASRQFEVYSQEILSACLPKSSVSGSFKFKERGTERDSPDVFVTRDGRVEVVVECKATKLLHKAQFSDDPVVEAKRAYDEISKAVVQLWRFYSANRRNVFDTMPAGSNTASIVLTMDNWLQGSDGLRKEVVLNAHAMADQDDRIESVDRQPVVFCSIEDLEVILLQTNDESFSVALAAAAKNPDYEGWLLSSIVRDLKLEADEKKSYPFDLASVLPWWNIEALRDRARGVNRASGVSSRMIAQAATPIT